MREDRVLLYLKSYLGDAVMVTPLLRQLESEFSNLTIITAPFVQPVLWTPDRENRYLPANKTRSPWGVVLQANRLRREGFDVAVLVNRSFRTALISRLAGIPRRIGHGNEGRDRLLTDVIPFAEGEFEAKSSLDLGKPLGLKDGNVYPSLPLTEAERERGRSLVGQGVVGIQPGARFPKKQLPFEVQRELARRLQSEGFGIAFLGGKEEREDAERLAAELEQPVVNLVGETSLRETLGVLANLKASAGADTGLIHLAVGVGCATVAVFGPTNADKWAHAYPPHKAVRAPNKDIKQVAAESILQPLLETLRPAASRG